ncbi:MAG: hypothetical protein OXF02_00720 [Simkaniaceae bacterium]|nr:hypothetical protein [Simkaniaceae bacterium]
MTICEIDDLPDEQVERKRKLQDSPETAIPCTYEIREIIEKIDVMLRNGHTRSEEEVRTLINAFKTRFRLLAEEAARALQFRYDTCHPVKRGDMRDQSRFYEERASGDIRWACTSSDHSESTLSDLRRLYSRQNKAT